LGFFLRRLLMMVPTLALVSFVAFAIIQLPPGDFLTSLAAKLGEQNESADPAMLAQLREHYGLDRPFLVQYWKWISGILLRGDFGLSFEYNRPVAELMWSRFGLSLVVSLSALLFVWVVALPIGVLSAVRQYSLSDHIATFIGFLGLAVPSFLLALALMYVGSRFLGMNVGGLFSAGYQQAPWSWRRLLDLLAHLWVPVLVLGLGGAATLIRVMRANLLDELSRPYVEMARARGLPELRLLLKYPVRIALNPFVSTIGWVLPHLVSGAVVTAVVLNLPTSGPMLLNALLAQDMYLAGSFILMLSVLTLVGSLISDVLLAWLDPRIRYA